MRKAWLGLGLLALLSWSLPVLAQDESEHEPEAVTIKGEIVDLGCYLGHGAKGAEHKGCALKCIAGGMPMGLLTEDGQLYLLTMSHADADPFNAAKDLAAETVNVTGAVHESNGMLSLEVTAVERPKTQKKSTPAGS